MTFQHDVLPGEPVIIVTLFEDFNFASDLAYSTSKTIALLDKVSEPVFLIDDLRRVNMSLDELIVAASFTSRGNNPLYHHPKVREVLFLTHSDMVGLAAEGLTTDTFGNVRARVFGTLEDALAYVRAHN